MHKRLKLALIGGLAAVLVSLAVPGHAAPTATPTPSPKLAHTKANLPKPVRYLTAAEAQEMNADAKKRGKGPGTKAGAPVYSITGGTGVDGKPTDGNGNPVASGGYQPSADGTVLGQDEHPDCTGGPWPCMLQTRYENPEFCVEDVMSSTAYNINAVTLNWTIDGNGAYNYKNIWHGTANRGRCQIPDSTGKSFPTRQTLRIEQYSAQDHQCSKYTADWAFWSDNNGYYDSVWAQGKVPTLWINIHPDYPGCRDQNSTTSFTNRRNVASHGMGKLLGLGTFSGNNAVLSVSNWSYAGVYRSVSYAQDNDRTWNWVLYS